MTSLCHTHIIHIEEKNVLVLQMQTSIFRQRKKPVGKQIAGDIYAAVATTEYSIFIQLAAPTEHSIFI
jgi:hypothetical protein